MNSTQIEQNETLKKLLREDEHQGICYVSNFKCSIIIPNNMESITSKDAYKFLRKTLCRLIEKNKEGSIWFVLKAYPFEGYSETKSFYPYYENEKPIVVLPFNYCIDGEIDAVVDNGKLYNFSILSDMNFI